MKKRLSLLWMSVLVLVISLPVFGLKPIKLVNRIEGAVYDPDHRPLSDIFIELMNDVGSLLARTKTNSAGRFTFSGISTGKFVVKVAPLGTNFMEQSQEVYVENVTRGNTDISYVDFYLDFNKSASDSIEKSPEAIFVQDVPPDAKKLYEAGLVDLKKNQSEPAFAKFEEALKIFPTYFAPLNILGKEYVIRSNYEKAYPYMLRAIDINPRSFSNFFRLGFSFYQLKQYRAALEAAKASVILVPDSIDAQKLYGKVLRIQGNYVDAEKTLLKANTLANGKDGETHYELALLYNRLNRPQETISELETFLKIVPNSPEKLKIQELIVKLKSSSANNPK